MANMKISIVILNYNGIKDTLECLNSVNKLKCDKFTTEVVIVDNNSTDGSQETLLKIKGIHLIQNQSNLGFSAGNNVGIKYALKKNSDYLLILNNDTIVDENLIISLLQSRKIADIISPKILFAPGFEFHKNRYKKHELGKIIWYAGGNIDWDNVVGKHIGVDEVDKGQFNSQVKVDFATGACMMIKKEVFKRIGFFDEKYFLYLEDMDFCVRAQKSGFKITYNPKGIVWHKNAISIGGSGSKSQDYYFTKSRLLFSLKHANLRTKIAVFKEIISKSKDAIKRKALFDFFRGKFKEAKLS